MVSMMFEPVRLDTSSAIAGRPLIRANPSGSLKVGRKTPTSRTRTKREPAKRPTAEPEPAPRAIEPEPVVVAEETESQGPSFGGTVSPARAAAKPRARKGRPAADTGGASKPFGEHTPAFLLRPVKVA